MEVKKKKSNSCPVSKLKKERWFYPSVPHGYGWKEFPLTDEWRLFLDQKGICRGFSKVKVVSARPRHEKVNYPLIWILTEDRFVNNRESLLLETNLPEVAALAREIIMEQIHGESDA